MERLRALIGHATPSTSVEYGWLTDEPRTGVRGRCVERGTERHQILRHGSHCVKPTGDKHVGVWTSGARKARRKSSGRQNDRTTKICVTTQAVDRHYREHNARRDKRARVAQQQHTWSTWVTTARGRTASFGRATDTKKIKAWF